MPDRAQPGATTRGEMLRRVIATRLAEARNQHHWTMPAHPTHSHARVNFQSLRIDVKAPVKLTVNGADVEVDDRTPTQIEAVALELLEFDNFGQDPNRPNLTMTAHWMACEAERGPNESRAQDDNPNRS
jgi:hypothetical protein